MNQTNHFFNLGYGWLCKHCSVEDAERQHHPHDSEEKRNVVSLALARWTDSTRKTLACPRCEIEESISA